MGGLPNVRDEGLCEEVAAEYERTAGAEVVHGTEAWAAEEEGEGQ